MARSDKRTRARTGVGPIALYALVCVAIGAAGAALVVAVLGEADRAPEGRLPPVRETQLVKAVQAGGCELRRRRADDQLRPPVGGPAAAPARPRFYDGALPAERLAGALRRGVIVISYRRGLEHERLEQLRSLQAVVPDGTIVVPAASAMRYEVVVAARRRLLGCKRFSDAAIDAIRLFRGRYIGTGPDR